jgi:hypothetical protein
MGRVASAAGTTLMLTSAVIASSLIWVAATDPMQLATAAARGDVWVVLATVASQVLAALW